MMNVLTANHAAIFRKILLTWTVQMILLASISNGKCDFEAIFNFGDSNSDTGGFYAAFPFQPYPNGMTYFKKPVGRPSDGRLYIDFFAQALGLPFLSPYLRGIGSDYRHGVNFATTGSTVRLPDTSVFVTYVSPFALSIQINQMKQFKALVDEAHQSSGSTNLPAPGIFGKSLYTIYIGQNDFTGNLGSIGIAGVQKYLPQVVSQISDAIKELYTSIGARTFLVLNLAPIGCYPAYLVQLPHKNSDIDSSGCMISYNNAVVEYNNMLKQALTRTKHDLPDANIIYVDSHSILLDLFQHPKAHGLEYGTKACCGYGGDPYNFSPKVYCGYSNMINGQKITASACIDPLKHASWDGYHTTEAANKLLVHGILNGSHFYPAFPLNKLCDIQPIG